MRRIHRATGFSPMQMLTGFTAEPLLPLGDLLSADTLQALSLGARLASLTLSAESTHRRTEIDIVTPYDSAWMHHYPTINVSTLSADLKA